MNEREIDLFDLLVDILSHWRGILVCMLVGAFLMGCFSYSKSYQGAEAKKASGDEQIQTLEGLLTDSEKATVHIVLDYEREYASYQQYLENSVLMQMDPSNIPTVEMLFKIQADDTQQSYALRTIYKDLINGMGMYQWAEEQTGIPSSVASELITAEKDSDTMMLHSTQRTGQNNRNQNVVVTHYGETASDVDSFKVTVVHYDETECERLAQCVKEYIGQLQMQLVRELGAHDVILLSESAGTLTDSRVLDKQTLYFDGVLILMTDFSKVKDGLSENQLRYYELLNERDTSAAAVETTGETRTADIKPSISKKYVLVGAVLFGFLYAGVFVVIYVLSSKLRTSDGLQELYDIPQLGLVVKDDGKKKFFIDRWIRTLKNWKNRQFTREQSLDLAATAIKISAGKHGMDAVFLMGCDLKAGAEMVCQELKERLERENITVKILDNVLYDAGAMEELESAKSIVLVEKAMSTMYDEICRELELVSRQGIKVLGGIIVE